MWKILTQGALRDPGLWLDNGVAVEGSNNMPGRITGHRVSKSCCPSLPTLPQKSESLQRERSASEASRVRGLVVLFAGHRLEEKPRTPLQAWSVKLLAGLAWRGDEGMSLSDAKHAGSPLGSGSLRQP